MKKIVSILLAAVMVLTLGACAAETKPAESQAPANRLEEIKARGYIEVATEPYFAPYEFIDPSKTGDDQYQGADIKIMQAIAEELGVTLKIVPLDFTAVLTGITTGKYDMAISAIAYNPERAENMNLSHVYMQSDTGYGFICRTEDKDKYNSIEDVQGVIIATQSGSVQQGLYNSDVKECKELKLFANMTDAYLAVQEGRADVCICSTDSAQLYADANGGKLYVPEFRFNVDPNMNGTVVALPKENTDELMEVVNKVVDKLRDDGSVSNWMNEAKELAKSLGIE